MAAEVTGFHAWETSRRAFLARTLKLMMKVVTASRLTIADVEEEKNSPRYSRETERTLWSHKVPYFTRSLRCCTATLARFTVSELIQWNTMR